MAFATRPPDGPFAEHIRLDFFFHHLIYRKTERTLAECSLSPILTATTKREATKRRLDDRKEKTHCTQFFAHNSVRNKTGGAKLRPDKALLRPSRAGLCISGDVPSFGAYWDLLLFGGGGGEVEIHDSTCTTRERMDPKVARFKNAKTLQYALSHPA